MIFAPELFKSRKNSPPGASLEDYLKVPCVGWDSAPLLSRHLLPESLDTGVEFVQFENEL